MKPPIHWTPIRRALVLAMLAIVAYLPVFRLPFVEDDYILIPMARRYAADHFAPLWHDVEFRTRALQVFWNAAVDHTFGYAPKPFFAASILLHVLCVLLVYALGVWAEFGFAASFWAAGFFAVYEGHQEAIMWPSGNSELLVFLFGMSAWVCWMKWLRGPSGGAAWFAAAMAAFALALFSKESAWIVPLLMLMAALADRSRLRRALAGVLPFFAMAVVYAGWIWISRVAQPGYSDIRFSLDSPWPVVIARSFWRMMFAWGIVAAAILAWIGGPEGRRKIAIAWAWMILGILPYSFLTYSMELPSRSTYLASAGLALLAGAAIEELWRNRRPALAATLAALMLLANVEILWVKKMAQFRERTEPSELLKRVAAEAKGPVTIECTPLLPIIAEVVVEQAGGRIASPQARRDQHCFLVQYTNAAGETVRIDRPVSAQKHGMFY